MTTKTASQMLREKFEKADLADIGLFLMALPLFIVGGLLLCSIVVVMVVGIIHEILK